jgi:hypothetical protein
MGWFKATGTNPSLNSTTADPDDRYNAVGLAGEPSGDSDGHAVRALLEVIDVAGTLRVVALGRRIDGGSSQTVAADQDWHAVLPDGQWVFLAATFNFDTGGMARYRNGAPLAGFCTLTGDPWAVGGLPEPDFRLGDRPARHQDRRQLPAEHAGAEPVQLPVRQPDIPGSGGHAGGDPDAVPAVDGDGLMSAHGAVGKRFPRPRTG